MRKIFILLALIPLICYSQKDVAVLDSTVLEYEQWIQGYILNPEPNDSLCITDINRAKKDLANGKIIFTQEYGFLFGKIRYEKELRTLCKEYGLIFDFEYLDDVGFEGQTQGCYGQYMNKVIYDKFGVHFKDFMHEKADSLYLINVSRQNIVVQYWDCDERPRLPDENERTDDYIPDINVNNIEIEKDTSLYGGWPFFDLGFIVEKDSTINGFYISNFVPHLDKNKKYENELYKIAVEHIKMTHPVWVPGQIKGVPVRTDNNVRVHFIRE